MIVCVDAGSGLHKKRVAIKAWESYRLLFGVLDAFWRECRQCLEICPDNHLFSLSNFFEDRRYHMHEMKEMVGGCCVCSDDEGWDDDPLVYCDGQDCTVAVHKGL